MQEQIKQLDAQRNAILREQERMREIERQQEERERAWQAEQERKRQLELEEERRKQAAAAAAGVAAAAGTAVGGAAVIGGIPSVPPPSYDQVNAIKNQGVRPANSAIYAPTPFANSSVPDSRVSPTAPPARYV